MDWWGKTKKRAVATPDCQRLAHTRLGARRFGWAKACKDLRGLPSRRKNISLSDPVCRARPLIRPIRTMKKYEDLEFSFRNDILRCLPQYASARNGWVSDRHVHGIANLVYGPPLWKRLYGAGDFGLPAPKPWQPWITPTIAGQRQGRAIRSHCAAKALNGFGEKMGRG